MPFFLWRLSKLLYFFSLGERLFKIDYVLRKFKAVVGNVLMY